MLLVAIAFVIGGTLGAVLTASIIASNQRHLTRHALPLPTRQTERWVADAVASRDTGYDSSQHTDGELARRLGLEASATARDRATAARRAVRPTFGVTIRVRQ